MLTENPKRCLAPIDEAKANALANFLFPRNGEWEWYVSPKGYKFIKIVTRAERVA